MGFQDQIKNLQVVVFTTPRTYLKWENSDEGRDKTDCYERILVGETLAFYVNTFNTNIWIAKGDSMWDTLEDMFLKTKPELISTVNNNESK